MNKDRKLIGIVLAIYLAAVTVAAFTFKAENLPNQMAAWVGGGTFVILLNILIGGPKSRKKVDGKVDNKV